MQTPRDVICDPRAPPDTPYYFANDRSLSVALGIAAFIGTVSVACAVFLLGFVLIKWGRQGWERHFRPLSVLFAFWILMDIVQGTSYALSLRWAVSGKVDKGGNYCVAQGVLEQFGDAGTALAAFSVAVLVVAYYHRVDWIVSNPRTVSWCLIISMVMILVILIVPPASVISHFYGNTGLWCWIAHSSPTNDRLQIGACYALMWLAALTSVFGYGYVLIGTLIGWNPSKVVTDSDIVLPTWTSKEAWGMFWYSLAYCIEVGPISIIRLVQFGSHGPCPSVKPGWTIFAISLLGASGLINTILWLTTKRGFGFSTEEERRRAIEAGRHS